MKKYFQLAVQIIRHGTLRHSGQNFHSTRLKSLDTLPEFVPDSKTIHNQKNSVNNLKGQLAYIWSSFRKKGGHLSIQTLAYIRIPKAANTSVSHAMLVKKYPSLKEKDVDETQINFLTDVNLLPIEEAEKELFFAVVRNPFARLVSVYRDFFETRHEHFIYADYLFGILPQSLSFAEFIERINQIPDRLKDQHFRPQHLFLAPYEESGIRVMHIQLEIPFAVKNFLNEHGMELLHLNKSKETYDYTQYYTPDLLRQVYALYEADIKKFGYYQEYKSLENRLQA